MGWYLTHPLHPRILHRHRGVKSLGDGVADESRAFLLKQLDEPSLLGDQCVDLGRLPVKERDDATLLIQRRNRSEQTDDELYRESRLSGRHRISAKIHGKK